MTSPLITSGRKGSRWTNIDRLEPDCPSMELATLKLKLKYQFYQTIMVACSTLLGVLIALLPGEFQPIEGRTLYLYCCFALALCTLLSGTNLYVLLKHPDNFVVDHNSERSKADRQASREKLHRLDVCEWGISLVLFFLLAVAFGILFLFLALMLHPDSEFLLLFTPYVPQAVLYAFVLWIVGVLLYLGYLLASSSAGKSKKASSSSSSLR